MKIAIGKEEKYFRLIVHQYTYITAAIFIYPMKATIEMGGEWVRGLRARPVMRGGGW